VVRHASTCFGTDGESGISQQSVWLKCQDWPRSPPQIDVDHTGTEHLCERAGDQIAKGDQPGVVMDVGPTHGSEGTGVMQSPFACRERKGKQAPALSRPGEIARKYLINLILHKEQVEWKPDRNFKFAALAAIGRHQM
jgi:hypothetical protein